MTDLKMEASTHLVPEEKVFGKLYESLKPIIWVLRCETLNEPIKDLNEDENMVALTYFTGFTVSKDLIMTCAHVLNDVDDVSVSEVLVKGRRLDEAGFSHTLKLHSIKKSWDIALFTEFKGELKDCLCGEFAQDGSLQKGETVMMIGHPYTLIGSCLLGSVAYKCLKEVTLPNGYSTCRGFKSDGYDRVQRYRKMGHIYNDEHFKKYRSDYDTFGRLDPDIPIIQCNGMSCNPGTSGAPIFNNCGKIVGMGIMGYGDFGLGVHVTLLQHFMSQRASKLKRINLPQSRRGIKKLKEGQTRSPI